MAALIQFDLSEAFGTASMKTHAINSNWQVCGLSHGLKISSKAINKEYWWIKLKGDTQSFIAMLVVNQGLFNIFIPDLERRMHQFIDDIYSWHKLGGGLNALMGKEKHSGSDTDVIK